MNVKKMEIKNKLTKGLTFNVSRLKKQIKKTKPQSRGIFQQKTA